MREGGLTLDVALIILRTEGRHERGPLGRERCVRVLFGERRVVRQQLLFYRLKGRQVLLLVRGHGRGVLSST